MTQKRLTDLKKRLKVSLLAISVITFLMIFSHHVVIKALLVVLVAGLAAVGLWEYVQLARAKALKPAVVPMIIVGVCEVVAFFFGAQIDGFFSNACNRPLSRSCLIFSCSF